MPKIGDVVEYRFRKERHAALVTCVRHRVNLCTEHRKAAREILNLVYVTHDPDSSVLAIGLNLRVVEAVYHKDDPAFKGCDTAWIELPPRPKVLHRRRPPAA